MRNLFDVQFKGKVTVDHWFATLLHSSTVAALTEVKTTFAELAKITLSKIVSTHAQPQRAERREFRGNQNQNNEDEFIEQALKTMSSLKPHDDIIPALKNLREHGFKTVAFSNSSSTLIESQIKNSGLENHFDKILSVETTGSFKPHPKVYQFAAANLNEPIENLRLVAAHDWDTHGALSAGMKAAFLQRSHVPYNALYKKPDIIGDTMANIADQIINQNN